MKTLADHIMDIVQNSVRASATLIEIIVTENCNTHLYTITIRDNGTGMTQEVAARALDPFFTSRTTRKVGLGLPLLKQNAEQSGGSVELVSQPGKGTTVTARFGLRHLDRPATGDMADMFILSVIANPGIAFTYSHTADDGAFVLRSADLISEIGFESLKFKEIRDGVKEMFRNNLDLIKATE